MWFWVVVALLWLAGEQWPAFKVALRVTAGLAGFIGLLILTKVGFVAPFVETLFSIPISLLQGVFGIVRALLFG